MSAPNSLPSEEKLARLLSRCVKTESGCLEWIGALNQSGYAWMRFDGRNRIGSRVMWSIKRGEIPDGICVLHRCDNRKCMNVDHLFLGTHAENMADMRAKGRGRKNGGAHNSRAKLNASTAEQIRRIYAAGGIRMVDVGRRFGVSPSTVVRVVHNRNWRVSP